MAFDKITHVPYLTFIGILILTLLGLCLYIYISSRRRTKTVAVQTYFTCLPKKPTSGELEGHGLAKMSLTKGKRIEYAEQTRYTGDPTSSPGDASSQPAEDTAYNMPDDDDAKTTSEVVPNNDVTTTTQGTNNVPRRIAPPIPEDATSATTKPELPPKQKDRNYENAHAWINTTENNYRMSQIAPIDTSRAYNDDDLISANFTDDSFETYEDEYVNTQRLGEINAELDKKY